MRKLVVVMLTVGSLLLLEAPALAQHLYVLSETGTEVSGNRLRFRGVTDCEGGVTVIFADDRLALVRPGCSTPQRTGETST